MKRLLDAYSAGLSGPLVAWYYTPMMLPFSRDLDASVIVFDAMDELSKFQFAPPKLLELEQELIDRADLVFTGGSSLYEAKKDRHPSVHCSPRRSTAPISSRRATRLDEPADQADIPRPRLGFYGVIDERFDIELLDAMARNAARLAVRDGRPGGEDRRARTCRGGRTSIISAARTMTSFRPICRAGTWR